MSGKLTLKSAVLATRPWSFTVTLVPVLVTFAVLQREGYDIRVVSLQAAAALTYALCVHAVANLTNTLFDYANGLDRDAGADDRTLVDGLLKPAHVRALITGFTLGAVAGFILLLQQSPSPTKFALVSSVGFALATSYTAPPLALKYRRLGDIVIVLCFGPLLAAALAIGLVGVAPASCALFVLPVALITEGVLHANNTRDIETDRKAGAATLAQLLGKGGSTVMFAALLAGAFGLQALFAASMGAELALPLLMLPAAWGLYGQFSAGQLAQLPQAIAQFSLPFGLLCFAALHPSVGGVLGGLLRRE